MTTERHRCPTWQSAAVACLLALSGCAGLPGSKLPTATPTTAAASADAPPGDAPPSAASAASAASAPVTAEPARLAAAAAPSAEAASASAAASAASAVGNPAAAAAGPEPEPAVPSPVPVDPLRPEVRIVLTDREPQIDLWTRVRRGFAMPDLEGVLTREREQAYASRPEAFQRMAERGSRYLFHIVEEVEKRGMPTELALLPFIESAFNPQALSSAKASGIWQFMPSTGKHFDLKQNVFRDDRRDVLASTRAALDYLEKLHGMFGDWHLALAAYNWGEGSVGRALARNKAAGLPLHYDQLKMPRETQHYVPKLQAMKNLVNRPEAFGLQLPALANHPAFLSVPIERDIDVDLAARLAGMPLADFKDLNPQTNKPVILAAGTAQVLLPYDNANQFVRQLPLHRGPLASWTAWVAPKTLRPADAAKQVGMSESDLREVNHIPPRMLVKAGSTLLVPRSKSRQTDVSEHLADHAVMTLAPDGPPLRRVALRAGKNDSVASVAKRYKLSASEVGQWNKVGATARFSAGQTIYVYLAGKASANKSGRRSTAAVKSTGRPSRHGATKKPAVRVSKN